MSVSDLDHATHRVDCAKSVGHMRHGYKPSLRVHQFLVRFQDYLAVVVDWNYAQAGVLFLAKHLPGDNVGVVFHAGNQDLIPCLETRAQVAKCYQVVSFRSPANEDDFTILPSMYQPLHLGAHGFIGLSRSLTQGMHATMDVGVVLG